MKVITEKGTIQVEFKMAAEVPKARWYCLAAQISRWTEIEPKLLFRDVVEITAQFARGLSILGFVDDQLVAHTTVWPYVQNEGFGELGTTIVVREANGFSLRKRGICTALYQEFFEKDGPHRNLTILATAKKTPGLEKIPAAEASLKVKGFRQISFADLRAQFPNLLNELCVCSTAHQNGNGVECPHQDPKHVAFCHLRIRVSG